MKYLFVLLAMLPSISLASGFGDEDATLYVIVLVVGLVFVAIIPLGFLGGFVLSIFTQNKCVRFWGRNVRWLLLPFSYFVAVCMGAMVWDEAGVYLDKNFCNPDKVGEFYNGTVCFWPVWVSAIKDVLFASYSAAIIILIPSTVAPMGRYAVSIGIACISSFLWVCFQLNSYYPGRHVVWHQILVGLVFVGVLFASCLLFRGRKGMGH